MSIYSLLQDIIRSLQVKMFFYISLCPPKEDIGISHISKLKELFELTLKLWNCNN